MLKAGEEKYVVRIMRELLLVNNPVQFIVYGCQSSGAGFI